MRVLSVFCDESGDFGPVSAHSPFYLVGFVFHEQERSIDAAIEKLESAVVDQGRERDHAIHTAPLIRREGEYANDGIDKRRRLFNTLEGFMRRCPITFKTFLIKKREFGHGDELADRIAKELGRFLRDNLTYFQQFDKVVVYYDLGQKQVTRTLRVVFSSSLSDVEFRIVKPEGYHLFQVADLTCTLELLQYKSGRHLLTASEIAFFGGANKLKKNHLKLLERKRFG